MSMLADRPVTKKKVLLCGHQDVLSEAMDLLLAERNSLEITRIDIDEAKTNLFSQIDAIRPEILIIHEDDQLEILNFLQQLPGSLPQIKVITLSLKNTYIDILDRQRIQVQKISDLMTAIEEM